MGMKKFCLVILLASVVHITAAGADLNSWMRRPVFFALQEEPAQKFLADLSNRLGVASQVSPRISGTLSGRFSLPDSSLLFDLLAKGHGIQWYYDGGRVFYYASDEIVNASISLRTLEQEQIKERLQLIGAYDDRFEMRSIKQDSQTILYINAPPRYIEIINELVERLDVKPKGDKIMRLFRLNHAWARDQKITMADGEQTIPGVASMLQQIVASEMMGDGVSEQQARKEARSTVMPDLRLNAVVVWESKDRMGYFESIIRDLDQETELVEIRVAIVDVGIDYSKELGLGLGYQRRDGRGGFGLNQGSAAPNQELFDGELPTFANTVGSGGMAYTILGHGMHQFLVQINALESKGNAKVLSRPAILTMDNVQSTFERTETFYVRLEGQEDVELEEITYGTILRVTPHIISHPDGRRRIQMMVTVEDGSATDTGEVDNIPRTVNSRVDTQAVVAEGQALVLGGHYSEVYKDTKSGVPIISRIPGFGKLFQNKRKDSTTYERMFVISPRIVTISDLPIVQDDISLQESFDSQLADPVFRMPSVSDSIDEILERQRREESELNESRRLREAAGDELPGEPARNIDVDANAIPVPAPEYQMNQPAVNGMVDTGFISASTSQQPAWEVQAKPVGKSGKWVAVDDVVLPERIANDLVRLD